MHACRAGRALSGANYHAITQVLRALAVPAGKAAGRVSGKVLVYNLTNKPGLMAAGLSEVILQGRAGVKLLFDMVDARSACQLPDGAADSLVIAASVQEMAFRNPLGASFPGKD